MTDAGILAEQMLWAATTPAAHNQALNIANGDVFRWRWMWPRLAAALGVEPVGFDEAPRPLEQQMAAAGPVYTALAERAALRGPTSPGWRRGGTPTATSAATSSASRT